MPLTPPAQLPSRLDAVTFGEAMVMFRAEDNGPLSQADRYTRALAGAEVNVAIGLSRLGHATAWAGRVGDDPLGAHVVSALRGEGIDTGAVDVDPHAPTGFQLKGRADVGDPEVVYFRSRSAGSRLASSPAATARLTGARHLHVTGIPPALSPMAREFTYEAMETARAAGLTISFDPNLRPALWPDRDEMVRVVGDLAARADWVLPGLGEGRLLTGRDDAEGVARHYLAAGARRVVVKDGGLGATRLFQDDGCWVQPLFTVRSVDSVGAGDGFAAGLISAHLDGLGAPQALRRAAAVGALATTRRGDSDGLPTRAELDEFLKTHAAA
ncbi:sugar kinase [Streptomyces antnestii]|uniref:sugar kinase n=1 Tax=Streptomyces antnestii TaxID=2494256 RepID=UPI001CB9C12B|nr:sugar kinase [Streptomyces sp. San01]